MLRQRTSVFVSLAVLCCAVIVSQPVLSSSAPPKFSSLYTNLKTECKNAFKRVGEGQDMPLRCKGYGGYFIYIYYSAWASHIAIQSKKSDDSPAIASQSLGYSDEKGRKIEWRLANGKPFAVILRLSNYNEAAAEAGESPYADKYKTGESLIVKGLKGYEQIDFTIDAKSPNANATAREMADTAFTKRRAG